MTEQPQGAEGCIREESCRHQRETKKCVVPSGSSPDATTLRLERHDSVGDEDIGDKAKSWKHKSEEMPIVFTFLAELVCLQLEDSEDLDSFFHQRKRHTEKATRIRGSSLRNLFNNLVLNGLLKLSKWLKNFLECTAQWRNGKSGSVALAVKRKFKNGLNRGICFVSEIHRNFNRNRMRKGGEGSKHESVVMGRKIATSDEEYWTAVTQWKTAGVLADSGCWDDIVANIHSFLDIVPIQSFVRNSNREASKVVGRGCVRIRIPSKKR